MKRLWLVALVVAVVAGACTSDASTSESTLSETQPSTTTAVDDSQPAETTTTTEPPPEPIAVPAGVVWEKAEVSDGPPLAEITAIVETDDGWLAVGRHIAEDLTLFSGFWIGSADGLGWDYVAVPDEVADIHFNDIAADGDTIVAVGIIGSDCQMGHEFEGTCRNRKAAAAVSTDGGQTWSRADHDGTFTGGTGGVGTVLREVEVNPAGGFVAVGLEERQAGFWPAKVWVSDDGSSWSVSYEMEAEWPTFPRELAVVGDRLVVQVNERVCSFPFDNGFTGWVLGTPGTQSRLFWSDDGVDWVEEDIIAAGMVDAYEDPPPCSSGILGIGGTGGILVVRGGQAFFDSGESSWMADAAGSWQPVADIESFPGLVVTADGWANPLFEPQLSHIEVSVQISSDLETWEDFTDLVPLVDRISDPVRGLLGGIDRLIAGGDRIVAAGYDASSGERAPVFLVSAAATVPAEAGTCEPAPGADCSAADLAEVDLAGADLTGIDLRFAQLRDVNLSGADLTGADLTGATLAGADISNAILRDAVLIDTLGWDIVMDGADFTNALAAKLSFDPLPTAVWDGAVLTEMVLHMFDDPIVLRLDGTNLSRSWLSGPLQGSSFRDALLVGANLEGNLTDVDFTGADLTSAHLRDETDLTGALFAGAVLDETKFDVDFCPNGSPPENQSCEGHFIDR
jgi:uncharacterized protein YjbI with pentapeptide repeats